VEPKKFLKRIIPDSIIRFMTGFFYGWHGNYGSWNDAKSVCSGYESSEILEKVKNSLLHVKAGHYAFERDSVLFSDAEFSFPLLSSLMWIAAHNNGKLKVLDFGGSLGSTYYQNKMFLDSISEVAWCIVEQPEFVKTGKEYFEDERLHFFCSIDECLKSFPVNVVLLSSVLQYLEEPYILIDQIKLRNIKYVIIDRTPFIEGTDRITVQKANPRIYKASYPCWFFNKKKFIDKLSLDYNLVVEFDALDKANIRSEFKGFVFKKI
jgi:putative methyltransferase (TIGR04325 family)